MVAPALRRVARIFSRRSLSNFRSLLWMIYRHLRSSRDFFYCSAADFVRGQQRCCRCPGQLRMISLAGRQWSASARAGGEVNALLLTVGVCCGCPTKGVADRRQSLPPATATCPAAPHAASPPLGCGPPILDFGVSVVERMANLTPHRKGRDGVAVAPPGLARIGAGVPTET